MLSSLLKEKQEILSALCFGNESFADEGGVPGLSRD